MTAAKKGFDITANPASCVGCRLCQMRCSFRFAKRFSFSDALIDIEWNEEQFCYNIKLNDGCDNCGLCVRACVYGALLLER